MGHRLRPRPGRPGRPGAAVGGRPQTRCRVGDGAGLFSARAYTPADGVGVLRALMAVIDERGAAMAGTTRLHQPTVGDPLHVLVIDELAALTAYTDLVDPSGGRPAALRDPDPGPRPRGGGGGVACRTPARTWSSMRGLFTQTIALRLRSADETVMMLGDGMTHTAPAHRISPTYPGTAWVVEDTGAADRVRADYWPDNLIRDLSGVTRPGCSSNQSRARTTQGGIRARRSA